MADKPIDDGGPAFPRNIETRSYADSDRGCRVMTTDVAHDGLSLRDYFAAHAPDEPAGWTGTAETYEKLSRPDGKIAALMEWRWFYADQMLAARKAGTP